MKHIIVKNNNKFSFAMKREHGGEFLIKAGASIPISETELMMLAQGRTFSGGYLTIVNKEVIPESIQYLFAAEQAVLELNEEEVESKLSGKMGDFYEYMKEIEERNQPNEKKFVFNIAKGMDDLAMRKANKVEEVTGFNFEIAREIEADK